MKTHFAGFRCYRCASEQGKDYAGYACPACGGNLEVRHAWPQGESKGWWIDEARRDLFRYGALLGVSRLELASPLRVGQTPLYEAPRLGAAAGLRHVYVKDEGLNPSASFKDRAGAVALVRAREIGAEVVCGASTGNAGSSMACLAASVGMPCAIFVPETAPPAKLAQLLVFGATVLAVEGTYDDAFDLCMAVCERRGWFNRNTGYNPFTREGKKTAAFEIFEQLGRVPDWVSVSTGDGNILAGVWKGFCDLKEAGIVDRTPKMLCAQSEKSDAISRAAWTVRRAGGEPDWKALEIAPVRATTIADSISVDVPRDGLAAVRAVVESGGAGGVDIAGGNGGLPVDGQRAEGRGQRAQGGGRTAAGCGDGGIGAAGDGDAAQRLRGRGSGELLGVDAEGFLGVAGDLGGGEVWGGEGDASADAAGEGDFDVEVVEVAGESGDMDFDHGAEVGLVGIGGIGNEGGAGVGSVVKEKPCGVDAGEGADGEEGLDVGGGVAEGAADGAAADDLSG
jgi:threonine synthase